MKRISIVSPEDQKVTFVELFFDLVFVFSVTQVVSLLHNDLVWITVGQAILVFWLVWWGWTQLTWALNAANTNHHLVQFGVLVAAAIALFMGISLPQAFQDRALWFAITYISVRVIGLILFSLVALEASALVAALRTWIVLSISGLIAVLVGGYMGGAAQYWLWGFAILLDIFAAAVGGQAEGWNIHPDHFSERHGLFVIIALGETLIVAASEVTDAILSIDLVAVGVLVVAITCALWWSYFVRAKPALDHALESSRGAEQSTMARSVYSLLHFPMLFGVIAYAALVETAVAHPVGPLPLVGRIALALGLVLFVAGMAAAVWRATGILMRARVLLSMATAIGIVAFSGVSAVVTLMIALTGILAILVLEQRTGSLIVAERT
ncbi:MAG: low temperature requirement protein A [Chloroflexi bacterium]|nr:low temperature requirement protein A [Chloroflexota bacterium]